MKKYIIITIACLFFTQLNFAQKKRTDANIVGHVVDDKGNHLPFSTVVLKGTTIGTSTDGTGHYRLINLPEGSFIIIAQFLGYKPQELNVQTVSGMTKEVNFTLQKDILGLNEVVITGDRNEVNRKESSTIVNVLTKKQFDIVESVVFSESLNFCPGLRTEANCANCGFTQVRINGMQGQYSQVLINSRQIFSGLAGVYGLELIPSNMIERIEVVRGGGSALFGGNAIAGTINLILKDPVNNSFMFGVKGGLTGVGVKGSGDPAQDYTVNFNSSLITSDAKAGIAIYGFYRNRQAFDANGDNFSELTSIKNTTIGSHVFHRTGVRGKLSADFFNIREERRGGDKMDYLPHMSGIAEALDHNITTVAMNFDQYLRDIDKLTVYASAQYVDRKSYYGANESLSDYGRTREISYNTGVQYNAKINIHSITLGIEDVGSHLKDVKLGYPDIDSAGINFTDSTISIPIVDNHEISDQTINTVGVFAQYELTLEKLKISAGARFDNYNITNKNNIQDDKSGSVLSPRITVKYDIWSYLQSRISYSQGYRAPQIFDEDLHIETSGARRVIHVNDPGLKQETSHSVMFSMDFNKKIGASSLGILVEGFYTKLSDAFANEIGTPEANGTVIYTRINAKDGAIVKGVNLELNYIPADKFALKGGFTIQSSMYEQAQDFDEKRFFRTPNDYGYLTLDYLFFKYTGISASGTYTGSMLVPYFGESLVDPDIGELRTTGSFFDIGVKIRHSIPVNGTKLQFYAGVKNIFNSYQDDFDRGIDRDPGYVYGPASPRSIYFGMKFGNILD